MHFCAALHAAGGSNPTVHTALECVSGWTGLSHHLCLSQCLTAGGD